MLYMHNITEKKTRQLWGYVWAEDEGHARRIVKRDQSDATHCRKSKHGLTVSKPEDAPSRDDGPGFAIWL